MENTNSNDKKVLIVLLDALRHDYLNSEDTPFLYSLSNKSIYVKKLVPGYGFCERSEILTGSDCSVTGNFSAYTYNPNKSPFNYLKHFHLFTSLLDSIEDLFLLRFPSKYTIYFDKLQRQLRKRLQRYYRYFRHCYDWNQIPFKFFNLFELTEDTFPHTSSNAFEVPSIYDLLIDKELSFYHGFQDLANDLKNSYNTELENLYSSFSENNTFTTFAIGHLDTITHKYGTSRSARLETLKNVDNMAKSIFLKFKEKNPSGYVIFFGDHGMLDVKKNFDAKSSIDHYLKRKRLKVPSDISYFLDSTMVRFWGSKSHIINDLVHSNEWSQYGKVIDVDFANKLGLNNFKHNYGEIIWWANPGIVVFPDFFRRYDPPLGMHGYDINHDDHKGLALLSGYDISHKLIDEGHLVDIAPTVCRLLDLGRLIHSNGKSWV